MNNYPWYTIVAKDDHTLHQGDFISDCPILIPPSNIPLTEDANFDAEVTFSNVIIMSQSCDLASDKISIVQVCPYYNLEELKAIKNASSKKEATKIKEELRKGIRPGFHLLNTCTIENHQCDYLYVDFRHIYGVDLNFLKSYVQSSSVERKRLMPPYREHLAQAFARFFMRVGLPSDIPPF